MSIMICSYVIDCVVLSRSIHNELRLRILKESKTTIKTVDRYSDKIVQKKIKYQRASIDRSAKESLRVQKQVKDLSEKIKISNDVKVKAAQLELDNWFKDLNSRIVIGRDMLAAVSKTSSVGAKVNPPVNKASGNVQDQMTLETILQSILNQPY